MPVEDDDYVRTAKDTFFEEKVSKFETGFDDGEVTSGAIVETILDVVSEVLAQNQEQSLDEIFDASFLDRAEGEALDLVVDSIGMSRREAVSSTGVVTWSRGDPTTQDYVIQNGTSVTTGGNDPIPFETTESAVIRYLDGFESGSLDGDWAGDTGNVSVQDLTTLVGNFSLELDATDGALVYLSETEVRKGSTVHWTVEANTDTVPIAVFGLQDASNYYQVAIDEGGDEIRLERVEDGSIDETLVTRSTTVDATTFDVTVEWDVDHDVHVTVVDSSSGNEIAVIDDNDDTWHNGFIGCASGDANGSKFFDELTMSRASSNVRAIDGGSGGNVGSNTVTNMPSPPIGVDSVTNPLPVGDTNYTDTDGILFTEGQPREGDDALRQRARETTTVGGSATVDALLSSLVNEFDDDEDRGVDNVESARIFTNRTNTDNTGSDGLPPKSFEAVVHGGDGSEIARAIFDTMAITDRSYGGAHGTEVSETIVSLNGQEWDISFSRPTVIDVEIEISLVVDETYAGNSTVRDDIVDYVGGTNTDDESVLGTAVDENVRVDEIQQVVNEVEGVLGFDESASTTFSTTPSSATTDGLDVIAVGESEIAQVTASNVTITTATL